MTPEEAYRHNFDKYMSWLANNISIHQHIAAEKHVKGEKCSYICHFSPHYWPYLDSLGNYKHIGSTYLASIVGSPSDATTTFLTEFKKVWPTISLDNYDNSTYYYKLTIHI